MFKLLKYLKQYKKQAIIGPFFKLIEAIFELIVPLIMARIIDYGINGEGQIPYILKMGGVLVLLAITGLCSSLICQTLASIASQGYGTVLRNELYKHINTLSYKEIDVLGTPTIITRITTDVNQMQVAVAMLIRLVVRAPFLVIGATIMACIIDIKIGLIFVLVAIVVAIILYFIMSRSVPYYKNVQGELDNVTKITRENLQGNRVIRAFSREKTEEVRFKESCNKFSSSVISVSKISSLLNPLTYLLVNIGIICILWFGGSLVNSGDLSQGDITALVNYMTQISLALIVVANLVVIFTKASASASRINEVLSLKNTLKTGSEDIPLSENIIEFDNVNFSYNNTKNVLEDINFVVKRRQHVGIIGATGSGKSTIASLICHLYDVTRGSVKVCGVDVRDINPKKLTSMIGYVSQKNVLFSGTIRENLSWRKSDVTNEEIYKALEIAQAKDLVLSKEGQLDYELNQNARNLSGGQKQRLTIAKALIGNPQILILDDSSSALDFVTDLNLRKALKENTTDLTVITISQRISTLKQSDFIICLNDGKIDGIGTHEYLLENSIVYKEIYSSQYERGEE